MEACVAQMVGSAVERGRSGFPRRRRGKLYGAGCRDRQAALALPSRGVGVFVAEGVRHRWKGVHRGGCGFRIVHLWPAINASKIFTRSTSQSPPARKLLRSRVPSSNRHTPAARAQPTATQARTRKLERPGPRKNQSPASRGTSPLVVLRRLSPPPL